MTLAKDILARAAGVPHKPPARKTPNRTGQRSWSPEQDRQLERYIAQGLDSICCANRLGRTANAISARAKRLGLSFKN